MGHKPKVYFVVREGGVLRELFNVRDRKQQGIVINPRHARMEERPPIAPREMEAVHYSVHPTKGGADTMITYKSAFKSGSIRSCATYIHETEEHLLWPVFSVRQHEFAGTSREFRPHPRDGIVPVADYDQRESTLMYAVFVTSRNIDHARLSGPGYYFYRVDFERHSLIVVVTFLRAPTFPVGDRVHLLTSTPLDDDLVPAQPEQLFSKSFRAGEMEQAYRSLMVSLTDRLEQRLLERRPGIHAEMPDLNERLSLQSAEPFPFRNQAADEIMLNFVAVFPRSNDVDG